MMNPTDKDPLAGVFPGTLDAPLPVAQRRYSLDTGEWFWVFRPARHDLRWKPLARVTGVAS